MHFSTRSLGNLTFCVSLSTVQPAKAWEKAAVLLLLAGLGALALIVGKGGLFG